MSSAFNYDDALGEYTFPVGLGYEEVKESGLEGGLVQDKGEEALVPKIILMGLKRSGKSSISKVVFQKMSPNETLFLEGTTRALKSDVSNSFMQFQVWDYPGQMDFASEGFDAQHVGAVIFVIDAQDDYSEALVKLHATLQAIAKMGMKRMPNIEVFIHKVDGLSDDHRIETQRDLQQKVIDSLQDDGLEGVHPSFHLTSIYDHSIFESMSKVIQKLIPHMDTLENLLDILISNCSMEKAFLIDTSSKIYIATDSSPVDMGTYELCSDVIDVVVDLSCIYGMGDGNSSVMKLKKPNSRIVLYLQSVNRSLALVCLMREENFTRPGVVQFNFRMLRDALDTVFAKKPAAPVGGGE